jgi:hypothetical protein
MLFSDIVSWFDVIEDGRVGPIHTLCTGSAFIDLLYTCMAVFPYSHQGIDSSRSPRKGQGSLSSSRRVDTNSTF